MGDQESKPRGGVAAYYRNATEGTFVNPQANDTSESSYSSGLSKRKNKVSDDWEPIDGGARDRPALHGGAAGVSPDVAEIIEKTSVQSILGPEMKKEEPKSAKYVLRFFFSFLQDDSN
jgi:hypothetical protein